MKLLDKIKKSIEASFYVHPNFPPLLAAAIPAIIALIGTGVSAASQASAANKQIGATEQSNLANMALNSEEIGVQKEQADTAKYSAHAQIGLKSTEDFLDKIKGSPIEDRLYDIWSGRAPAGKA